MRTFSKGLLTAGLTVACLLGQPAHAQTVFHIKQTPPPAKPATPAAPAGCLNLQSLWSGMTASDNLKTNLTDIQGLESTDIPDGARAKAINDLMAQGAKSVNDELKQTKVLQEGCDTVYIVNTKDQPPTTSLYKVEKSSPTELDVVETSQNPAKSPEHLKFRKLADGTLEVASDRVSSEIKVDDQDKYPACSKALGSVQAVVHYSWGKSAVTGPEISAHLQAMMVAEFSNSNTGSSCSPTSVASISSGTTAPLPGSVQGGYQSYGNPYQPPYVIINGQAVPCGVATQFGYYPCGVPGGPGAGNGQ